MVRFFLELMLGNASNTRSCVYFVGLYIRKIGKLKGKRIRKKLKPLLWFSLDRLSNLSPFSLDIICIEFWYPNNFFSKRNFIPSHVSCLIADKRVNWNCTLLINPSQKIACSQFYLYICENIGNFLAQNVAGMRLIIVRRISRAKNLQQFDNGGGPKGHKKFLEMLNYQHSFLFIRIIERRRSNLVWHLSRNYK